MEVENTISTRVTQAKKDKYSMCSLYVDRSFGTVTYLYLGGSKWATLGN